MAHITPETNSGVWMDYFDADSTIKFHHSPKFPKRCNGEKVISYAVTEEGLTLLTGTSMFMVPRPGMPVMIARLLGHVEDIRFEDVDEGEFFVYKKELWQKNSGCNANRIAPTPGATTFFGHDIEVEKRLGKIEIDF